MAHTFGSITLQTYPEASEAKIVVYCTDETLEPNLHFGDVGSVDLANYRNTKIELVFSETEKLVEIFGATDLKIIDNEVKATLGDERVSLFFNPDKKSLVKHQDHTYKGVTIRVFANGPPEMIVHCIDDKVSEYLHFQNGCSVDINYPSVELNTAPLKV